MLTFGNVIILAGYEINKEYITLKFCVNKSRPMMQCKGKCHMQKQLSEQNNKENQASSVSKEKYENFQFVTGERDGVFHLNQIRVSNIFHYSEPKVHNFNFSVFHPPPC
jgi:hypothetical protein